MDTEKVIVLLLLVAILLSVITISITMSADVVVRAESGPSDDVGTASVILNIVKNPAKGNLGWNQQNLS